MSKVTVVTATTGRPELQRAIESVAAQTYKNIDHLIIVDGPAKLAASLDAYNKAGCSLKNVNILSLPYPIGIDNYVCHRIYGMAPFMIQGDYLCYLDDDNWYDPDHVESLMRVIQQNKREWAYSFRKLVNHEGKEIGTDDCESLGKWPSILSDQDYFIDTNCYFMPKMLAVTVAPVWYRKTRVPGVMEADRACAAALRQIAGNYDSNYRYSVNYTVGGGPTSVQPDFFRQGNELMLKRHNGKLPWKQSKPV